MPAWDAGWICIEFAYTFITRKKDLVLPQHEIGPVKPFSAIRIFISSRLTVQYGVHQTSQLPSKSWIQCWPAWYVEVICTMLLQLQNVFILVSASVALMIFHWVLKERGTKKITVKDQHDQGYRIHTKEACRLHTVNQLSFPTGHISIKQDYARDIHYYHQKRARPANLCQRPWFLVNMRWEIRGNHLDMVKIHF